MVKTEKKRNIKRSSLSGKIINGKEVILVEEAKDYVIKQGYEVKIPTKEKIDRIVASFFVSLGLFIFVVIAMMTMVSASSFEVDYQHTNLDMSFSSGSEIDLGENTTIQVSLFHNITGAPVTNSSAYCEFYLYNSNQESVILERTGLNNLTYDSSLNNFQVLILSGNFTEEGNYFYVLPCFLNDGTGSARITNFVEVGEVEEVGLLVMDFSKIKNQIILGVVLLITMIIYIKKQFLLAGFVIFILGVLFALNNINVVISMIVMAIGLLMMTQEEG